MMVFAAHAISLKDLAEKYKPNPACSAFRVCVLKCPYYWYTDKNGCRRCACGKILPSYYYSGQQDREHNDKKMLSMRTRFSVMMSARKHFLCKECYI